jgi:glycosyltransferase involved in cell wall biosynthesis
MHANLISWGIPPHKIHSLPNGVDLDRFSPPPSAEVQGLRNQLMLENFPVVLYIGSLSSPSHPVELLLDAFVLIHKANPQIKLVLVGGGEDFSRLKQQADNLNISPSVRFCGRVAADKVVLYYHLANISVDPVLDNDAAKGRSPLKLFESWACGVPFVTGDVGDRRSLIGDPPAGVLTKPGDPASLAEQILMVLANRGYAEDIRKRGMERARAYSWEDIASNINQAYLSSKPS